VPGKPDADYPPLTPQCLLIRLDGRIGQFIEEVERNWAGSLQMLCHLSGLPVIRPCGTVLLLNAGRQGQDLSRNSAGTNLLVGLVSAFRGAEGVLRLRGSLADSLTLAGDDVLGLFFPQSGHQVDARGPASRYPSCKKGDR
jgi:hypothetical protein